VLVPIVACALRYKAFDNVLKVLFFYLIICAITEAVSYLLAINKIHNYFVRHLFTFLECTLITTIYFLHFQTNTIRNFIKGFYFVFFSLSLVIMVFNGGYSGPDNILSSYEACLFIGLPLYFLYKEINDRSVPRLNEYYFFWLNSAILIYFGISFFLFLFGVFIEKTDSNVYNYFRGVSLSVNVIYNTLLAVSVWKIKKT
jgi:hypothetical protein